MQPRTFHNIIDKYQRCKEDIEINNMLGSPFFPIIVFSGFGEPLLHPKLFDFISYAHKKGFITHLITNGSLLTPNKTQGFINAGINIIYFTFYGVSKDIYEENTEGLNFEQSLNNIEYLNSISNGTIVRVKVNEVLEENVEQAKLFWIKKGIKTINGGLNNRAGYFNNSEFNFEDFTSTNEEIWCGRFFLVDQITWDGNIILCANDINHSIVLGNINKNDCKEITNLKSKIKKEFPICYNCKGDSYRNGGLIKDMNEYIMTDPDMRRLIWGNKEKELCKRFLSIHEDTWD